MIRHFRLLLSILIFINIMLGFGLAQDALAQSPHGNYTATTDACAGCHRTHVAPNAVMLTYVGNDLCNSCHGPAPALLMLNTAPAPKSGPGFKVPVISTHSNAGAAGKTEGAFQLGCAQCHGSHGDSQNLHDIKEFVPIDPAADITAGPIVFTATVGLNSYDDGTDSGVCVTCHINPGNPGYPMANHSGGVDHEGGIDYIGVDCITCHPHDADGDPNTPDGFMPITALPPLLPTPTPTPYTEKSFRFYLPPVCRNATFSPSPPSVPNQSKSNTLYLPLIMRNQSSGPKM